MIYEVTIGERARKIEVKRAGDAWLVSVDGGPERRIAARGISPAEWLLAEGDDKHVVGLFVGRDAVDLQVRGHAVRATVVDPRRKALDLNHGASQGEVRTQMPGAVVRVPATVGQEVHKGQVLVVVEAMKMENEFKAPIAGTVAAIHVKPGQAVEANTMLVTLEPA